MCFPKIIDIEQKVASIKCELERIKYEVNLLMDAMTNALVFPKNRP